MKFFLVLTLTIMVFLAGCTSKSYYQDSSQNSGLLVDQKQNDASTQSTTGYTGKIIAGSATPYREFNKVDYEKSLAEGKVIYLYFYATWCPICKAERPNILQAFDEMSYPGAVGFEVHYNDGQDTKEHKDMARTLGVSYQHTTIIVGRNGEEFFRSLSPISKDEIKNQISNALKV